MQPSHVGNPQGEVRFGMSSGWSLARYSCEGSRVAIGPPRARRRRRLARQIASASACSRSRRRPGPAHPSRQTALAYIDRPLTEPPFRSSFGHLFRKRPGGWSGAPEHRGGRAGRVSPLREPAARGWVRVSASPRFAINVPQDGVKLPLRPKPVLAGRGPVLTGRLFVFVGQGRRQE